jgi:hypothetical protein
MRSLFTNCREEVFSETQLPLMLILGSSEHSKSRVSNSPRSCYTGTISECLVDAEAFDYRDSKSTRTLRKKESSLGVFVRLTLWFLRIGKC